MGLAASSGFVTSPEPFTGMPWLTPLCPAIQGLQDGPLLEPGLDGLLEVLQLALCLGQQPSGAQLLLQQNLPQQLPQLAAWLLRTTGEPHSVAYSSLAVG